MLRISTYRLLLPVFLAYCLEEPAMAGFIFAGETPYSDTSYQLNKGEYDSAGFNAIYALVDTGTTTAIGIDNYADYAWRVFGALAYSTPPLGWIYETGREARLIHIQAEDEGINRNWYGAHTIAFHDGDVEGPYWYVDPDIHHQSYVWFLSDYYQAYQVQYTALFYMKIDEIGNQNDTVASLLMYINRANGDSLLASRTLIAEDFVADDSLVPLELTYIAVDYVIDDSGDTVLYYGPMSTDIVVQWEGNRKLSMDSIVIFNDIGQQLMRSTSSTRLTQIVAQAQRFQDTYLPDSTLALNWWLGFENNWDPSRNAYMDMSEPAAFLDELLQSQGQGFMWDRNLTHTAYQAMAEDSVYFGQNPRHYMFWDYSLVDGFTIFPNNLDSIQERFNHIAASIGYARRKTDAVGAQCYYVVNAFGTKGTDTVFANGKVVATHPIPDTSRPTNAELKCMSFLGLAYGVNGLWYWPYDDGVAYYRGLTLNHTDRAKRLTRKYWAVRDTIAPVVHLFGPLIDSLARIASGSITEVEGMAGSFLGGHASSTPSDDYVEVGLFSRSSPHEDYALLVNRNTSASTTRQLTVTFNAAALSVPSQQHYYIIDLNKNSSATTSDTTLAGPLGGVIKYFTTIKPGDIRLLKIVPAPSVISGTNVPATWWGHIRADSTVTVSAANRVLRLLPGTKFEIDADSVGSSLKVYLGGRLVAKGTTDSIITFTRKKNGSLGNWNGLDISASGACSLAYSNFEYATTAIAAINANLVLSHVTIDTVVNQAIYAKEFLSGSGDLRVYASDIMGRIRCDGSTMTIDSGTVLRGKDTVVYMNGASCTGCADDLTIRNTKFTASGSMGVYFNAPDETTTVTLEADTIKGTGTGLELRGPHHAWVTKCSFDSLNVGMKANNGRLRLRDTHIKAPITYGVHALDGITDVWLDSNVTITGRPNTTVGVAIDTSASLVAQWSKIANSYIGFDIRGDGTDMVYACSVYNSSLYGIWFHGDKSKDSSIANVVYTDTASASKMGIYVQRQSIVSEDDKVLGGHNWNFNFYSATDTGLTARVEDLTIRGKRGDQWGLVLNGPYTVNADSAFVDNATIDSFFSGAHVYLHWLHAVLTECRLRTSTDSNSASNIGIQDEGDVTGEVACTRIRNQRTACVKMNNSGSSIDWAGDSYPELENGNWIHTSTRPSAKYFWNNTSSGVDIEHIYWGGSPSSSRFTGTVDYTPWESDTLCGMVGGEAKLVAGQLPEKFELRQNYPNPFNPTTTIEFALPIEQTVKLSIYNVLGEMIRRFELGSLAAGYRQVVWNGRNSAGQIVGSGMYFYRLETPSFTDTKKMLILK